VRLPDDIRRVKRVVEASFAHRRKRLVNSLELSGVADRAHGVAALARIDKPASVRAEELLPDEFLHLAGALQ
jgi:16S rRNA A1518/A1519 N6-dimethyltransferase RsmA/KsgA/DIM1 with predicted DNA glycosylase/AP lyase activity